MADESRVTLRLSQRAAASFGVAVAALIVAMCLVLPSTGDYHPNSFRGADNAGPVIDAIAHGRLTQLPAVQTVMGFTSILLRLPLAVPATWLGASSQLVYDLGAFACLLPIAGLTFWLARRAESTRERIAIAVAAVVMVVGAASTDALDCGHPEEILTAVLMTGAVLAAQGDRGISAAVLLGLAIGAKQWAIVLAPAVIVALPHRRCRTGLTALAVAALLSVPLPLLDPSAFHAADATIGPMTAVSPMSAWWPVTVTSNDLLPFGLNRIEAFVLVSPAAALMVVATQRRLRRNSFATRPNPMALLALLGLLRCVLDPIDLDYYLVALVVPLAVWEVHSARRLPVLALLSCGVQGLCSVGAIPFRHANTPLHNSQTFTALFECALPLAFLLTRAAFAPRPTSTTRLPRSSPAAVVEALPV